MDYSNCTALGPQPCPERVAEPASVTLWVPAGLAMGSAAALGFARFAYSLLLPEMRHGLHWSFAQAGALGTAMAVGYLFGSLLTVQAERWLGTARVFVHGLLLTAASLLAMALFRDYEVLLMLRFIAGFVTGCVFIAGFSLAARAGATSGRSSLFTIIYGSGAGIGMVLSGVLLPPVLASGWNWAGSWIVLGLLTLITIALAIPAVRSVPPVAAAAADGANVSLSQLRPILLAYFLYGAGYYALMTFVIAYLHAAGYGQTRIVDFWIVAGLAVSASMVLWGPLLGRMRGSSGVVLTTGVLIASALVLLLLQGTAAVMLSAVLFGGSLMASAFAHLDYARGLVPSRAWTRIIATMTVMFSLGQTAGPLLCGSIADYGGMRIGMFSAIGLLVLCIALASLQRESVTQ
ncbi:MAG: YbfB/YjiJ family MFS transporter [Burkholderiaceae bacterium]|nr:MAG: YbfB/YjiJ family MFS transporter [Burkholderiaceae bacterium]TAM03590.1 MAG: YbfB/YjiJ family MFS transporter [Pusillimonas sp.]